MFSFIEASFKLRPRPRAQSWRNLAKTVRNSLKSGGRACKPDSVPHASVKRAAYRGDHSSRSRLAPRLQRPTRGLLSAKACAFAEGARSSQRWPPLSSRLARTLTHRAGPALPSYLALHHAGFSVPRVLPHERWALTPPFHPYQTKRAIRRRLAGFPARCHRAALRRRYILCGTFRERSSQHRPKPAPPEPPPWRYQARCPFTLSPRKAGEGLP